MIDDAVTQGKGEEEKKGCNDHDTGKWEKIKKNTSSSNS